IPCEPPPDVPNGKHTGKLLDEFLFGTAVTYTCNPGHPLHGEPSIYCTTLDGKNGVWSGPPPSCGAGCNAPTRLAFAELKELYRNQTIFPVGRTVEFVCRPGYTQHIGMSPAITCLKNRTWSVALEFCKRKQCANPGDPENGQAIVLTDLLLGSKVNYTCNKGYKLVGGSQRTCEVAGTSVSWSGDAPACQRITCGPPPNISHGTHSGHSRDTFSYADVVTYTCNPGHPLAGEPSIICSTADGEHGVWSGPPPRCGATGCKRPEIKNGRSAGLETMYKLMDTVVFECDFGYALKGSRESQCQFGGKWNPPVPTCEKMLQCPSPPNIKNGHHDSKDVKVFVPGVSVKYYCDTGYVLTGKTTVSCLTSGTWSIPYPRCEVITCTSPSIQDGEVAEGQSTVYHPGANVTFQCHSGYVLWGSREAKCQPDGRWVPAVPICKPARYCSKPADIAHGSLSGPAKTFFTPGTSISYICEAGFSLIGTATMYCTQAGAWSHHPPLCQVVKCLRPPNITNGKLKGNISDTFSYGASVSYSCNPGYSLIGNAFINCTLKGTWSQPPPQCKEIRCVFPELQGVKKAIRGNTYRSGTNITLECDDGYTLEGNNQIQCQEDFSWDPPVPACKLMSQKSGSVGVGVVAAGVLLLLGAGIVWKIISKQKEGYYDTYENHSYQTPLNEITEQKCSCLQ
ncbi:PREDICTED: complement receptor type 1-like, partial [Nestor notabilis]|uniref:complement receptor type 1-like n=1 Tax=Nestor notabilis TaxID=176057 RepID=UPI0005233809